MINGKKVVVISRAYNAEKTLKKTYDEIPLNFIKKASCTIKCDGESSSINFVRSSIYGVGILMVSTKFYLQRFGLKFKLFE